MSNVNATYAAAPTSTVKGIVTRVNRGGLVIGEEWFNYGKTFRGSPLGVADVGSEIELTLVHAKGGKFIRSFVILAVVAAATETGPAVKVEPVVEMPKAKPPQGGEAVKTAEAKAPTVTLPAETPAIDDPPSEKMSKYAGDLAGQLGIAAERMDLLCTIRFGKAFSKLGRTEMKLVLPFLGARPNSTPSYRR